MKLTAAEEYLVREELIARKQFDPNDIGALIEGIRAISALNGSLVEQLREFCQAMLKEISSQAKHKGMKSNDYLRWVLSASNNWLEAEQDLIIQEFIADGRIKRKKPSKE